MGLWCKINILKNKTMTIAEKVLLETIKGDCTFSGYQTEECGELSIHGKDEYVLDPMSIYKIVWEFTIKRTLSDYYEVEGWETTATDKSFELLVLIEDNEGKTYELSKEFEEALKNLINEEID